ncbi:MAG: transporter substrate-binding domain-containing protein [Cyanobacteriota bacterium]|nr:transporter substrate-binding domain-containing protein [Cyanobacteriota bacterium]
MVRRTRSTPSPQRARNRRFPLWQRRSSALVSLACALLLGSSLPAGSQTTPGVLRVGVVDGAQPCTFRKEGSWKGLAVDLWTRVATEEKLPFILQEWPNLTALLAATRRGEVEVAVGCINLSPERLQTTLFSLPFQEDGLAVMALQNRFDLSKAFLRSLLGPALLQLLGGFLLSIGLLSLLTWRVERHGRSAATQDLGRLRSFARIFQILATGPGSNTIVETTRGHLLVLLAYLVRIVAASLLVGFLTVHVVEEARERSAGSLQSLEDLRGRRVAVRPGSISAALLEELNRTGRRPPIQAVTLPRVSEAIPLLKQGKADAVLADDLQLSYALSHHSGGRALPTLALRALRPESQGFAFSPRLDGATTLRIDLAISRLKRSGEVSLLREEALRPPAKARNANN